MDDENFEIIDYTTASIWESFVSSIENVLIEWGLDKGEPDFSISTSDLSALTSIINSDSISLKEKLQSTLKWSIKSQEVSYGGKRYILLLHRHPSFENIFPSTDIELKPQNNSVAFFQQCFPKIYLTDRISQTNSLDEVEGITDSSLFAFHPLHRWFASNYLISIWSSLSSSSDSKSTNSNLEIRQLLNYDKHEFSTDTSRLLQSALNVACQNISCSLPTFVPTGIGWNYLYSGRKSILSKITYGTSISSPNSNTTLKTSYSYGFSRIITIYETVKILSIPPSLLSISGLVKNLHSKFNPKNYPLSRFASHKNQTSSINSQGLNFYIKFTAAYYFRVKIQYDPLWNCNHDDFSKSLNNLSVGPTNDPLRQLGLIAYFPSTDCTNFLKFDSTRKFLYLKSAVCCKLSAKFIDPSKEAPLLFGTLSDLISSLSKYKNFSEGSYLSITYPDFMTKTIPSPNIEYSNPYRPEFNQKYILDSVESIFDQVHTHSDSYNSLSSSSDSTQSPITSLSTINEIINKAPYGSFFKHHSLLWRLSISILASCSKNNTAKNGVFNILVYLESIWKLIINEFFHRWEVGEYIPDPYFNEVNSKSYKPPENIDLKYNILQQKIDMVNFCIYRKNISKAKNVSTNSYSIPTSKSEINNNLYKRLLNYYLTSPDPQIINSHRTFTEDTSGSIFSPIDIQDDDSDFVNSNNEGIFSSESANTNLQSNGKSTGFGAEFMKFKENPQRTSKSPGDLSENINNIYLDGTLNLTTSFPKRNQESRNIPISIKNSNSFNNPTSRTSKNQYNTSNINNIKHFHENLNAKIPSQLSDKVPDNFSWSSNSFESKSTSDSSFDLCNSSFKQYYLDKNHLNQPSSKPQNNDANPSSVNSAISDFCVIDENSNQNHGSSDNKHLHESFHESKLCDKCTNLKSHISHPGKCEFGSPIDLSYSSPGKIENADHFNSRNFKLENHKHITLNESLQKSEHSGRLHIIHGKYIVKSNPPVSLWVPKTQMHPLYTEDMLADRERRLIELGDGQNSADLRAEIQSEELFSDMQAFKAANPDAQLHDFVQWHSPKDFVNCSDSQCNCNAMQSDINSQSTSSLGSLGSSGERYLENSQKTGSLGPNPNFYESIRISNSITGRGSINKTSLPENDDHLSSRMSGSDNLWKKLWKKAKRIPADQQTPLFDIDEQAKMALLFLKRISVHELVLSLFPTITLVLYDCFYKEPIVHKLTELTSQLSKLGQMYCSPELFASKDFNNLSNTKPSNFTFSKYYSNSSVQSKEPNIPLDKPCAKEMYEDDDFINQSGCSQDTNVDRTNSYIQEPLFINPSSSILSVIADQVKAIEINLGRAVSMVHQLPGQYSIIDKILQNTEVTVVDLKDRKSILKCLSQYGIGLKKPPVRREYLISSDFLNLDIRKDCCSLSLEDYHTKENLLDLKCDKFCNQENSEKFSKEILAKNEGSKQQNSSSNKVGLGKPFQLLNVSIEADGRARFAYTTSSVESLVL
ncbi:Rab3 GTPase-activating protein catalytic subunit [Smittium mucronatum]|uniref:Rab3 GTPase-activating protein catalytic subunit n=1 Tax=Smittium mucronatum TaxID=133383 RepID=A0A1R0GSE9_9FUNG|nr:Rab3 GTPase-activating protein catalytic subunit [Smittium mucronatum]